MTDTVPVARGVLISATSQIAAKVLHLALNVVSSLAIVRYLGPGDYGVYVLVLTVTVLVGLLADFGLPKLAVREISRADSDEGAVLGTVVVLRVGLALAAVGLTQAVLVVLQQSPTAHLAAAVASGIYLTDAVVAAMVVVFQVRFVQQYEAFVRTGAEFVETALILLLIAHSAALAWLFVPPVVGGLLAAIAVLALARGRYQVRPRFAAALVRPLVVAALPIGPAMLLGVVYRKLDLFTLAVLRPGEDVGAYGAAYQPIEYLFLTTALLINVCYPLLTTAHAHGDREGFLRFYRRGTEALVVVTVLAPVTLLFVAEPLVTTVFGPAYGAAARPLQLLSVTLVLLTVSVWQSLVLLVGGHQAVTLRYNAIALALAVVLCIAGVTTFGTVGAALAMIGTSAYVVVASTRAVRRRMDVTLDTGRLARIAVTTAVTVAALAVMHLVGLPWPALVPAAVLAFAAVAARLRLLPAFLEAVR